MTDVRALVDGGRPTGRGQVLRIVAGYVSQNRPAPAGFDDPVWVIVPSHSPDVPYGPMSFAAEHGASLPVAGSAVTLGIDDNGAPVVLRWEGSYS